MLDSRDESFTGLVQQSHITLHMKLIREADREIQATRRISASVPATSDSTLAIVAGFDAAMQVVQTEALNWLIAVI